MVVVISVLLGSQTETAGCWRERKQVRDLQGRTTPLLDREMTRQ